MKAGKRSNQRCRSLSGLSWKLLLTVRNPLFSVQKLIEQIKATFFICKKKQHKQQQTNKQTKTRKMIGMSLNVVHRHVREKRLTKKLTKRSDRLYNHFSFHTCSVSFANTNLIILQSRS